MTDCNICLKSLRIVKAKVSCVYCKNGYHGKCVNLSPEDINYLTEQGDVWCCDSCSKTRRKSMVLETKINVSFDDIFNFITELRNDCKKVEANLGASLKSCHEELAETKAMASKQREELAAWMEAVENLRQENSTLRKQIYGIPIQKGENVDTLVKAVGRALDYPVDYTMVDACHRLRARDETGKPLGIIVKMVRRLDAEGLLQKRRVKRNLNTHEIGLTSAPEKVVYVNKCLFPARRRVLHAARQVKKEKGYTYLWIRGGKILLRKDQGGKTCGRLTCLQLTCHTVSMDFVLLAVYRLNSVPIAQFLIGIEHLIARCVGKNFIFTESPRNTLQAAVSEICSVGQFPCVSSFPVMSFPFDLPVSSSTFCMKSPKFASSMSGIGSLHCFSSSMFDSTTATSVTTDLKCDKLEYLWYNKGLHLERLQQVVASGNLALDVSACTSYQTTIDDVSAVGGASAKVESIDRDSEACELDYNLKLPFKLRKLWAMKQKIDDGTWLPDSEWRRQTVKMSANERKKLRKQRESAPRGTAGADSNQGWEERALGRFCGGKVSA
ncbi:hypothetical protein J6590_100483 [Homalodisca vitripennis]|nr:hypothetical protein J6590_100483 [Homalodisca vitripennis]